MDWISQHGTEYPCFHTGLCEIRTCELAANIWCTAATGEYKVIGLKNNTTVSIRTESRIFISVWNRYSVDRFLCAGV